MLSHTDFNKHLLVELRNLRVFTLYSHEELESCIPERLILRLVPTDTISYYKRLMKFELVPRAPASSLVRHTLAECELIFTSNVARPELPFTPDESEFDFGRAIQADLSDPDRRIFAVNVALRISCPTDYCLGKLRKRLWNSEPPYVEGVPDYVRLLV